MTWLVSPSVTVIFAVRGEVLVLASAFTVTSASLEPAAGETVSHDWSLDAVHELLLVMLIVLVPPLAVKLSDAGDTDRSTLLRYPKMTVPLYSSR